MKSNLIGKVESLKLLVKPRNIDWARIYDFVHEANLSTAPGSPETTAEEWEQEFIEKHGSKNDFVKTKEEESYVRL